MKITLNVAERCFLLLLIFVLSSPCSAFQLESYQARPAKPVLNLVVVPLHYQDSQQFLSDVDSLLERLKQTTPFDEFTENISVWKIDISQEEQEAFFKKRQEFPYLKVRLDFLDGISEQVKGIYKLVIINAASSTSCAELSSVDKMSLIILGRRRYKDRRSLARGFLHELGHSLGLRDESLNSHAKRCSPGFPNCATTKEEAEKWWGDLVGKGSGVRYIHGCCGNRSYIRPTIASLMNDPDKARGFGPVNERYIREALQRIGSKNSP